MRWVMCAAAAVLLWPSVAAAGWRGAEWDMTPEQVAAATSGEAALVAKRRKSMEKTIGNRGTYVDRGTKFQTTYYFDQRGLAMIGLEPPRKFNCASLAEPLVAAYGDPVVFSDQVILRLVIWHDAKAATRIRLLVSAGAGICTLYYERLSDYEAYDKRPREAAPSSP